MPRWRLSVALVIAVLAAMALPAGGSALVSHDSARPKGDAAAAFATAPVAPSVNVARLKSDDRGENTRSPRSGKHGLVLLGLLAPVVVVAALGGGWSLLTAAAVPFHGSSWSPQSGRAPPFLQLEIA